MLIAHYVQRNYSAVASDNIHCQRMKTNDLLAVHPEVCIWTFSYEQYFDC